MQHLLTMPTPTTVDLDRHVLIDRIRDHGREIQLFLSSMLVSVAVANAAYVFALLLGSPIAPLLWLPFVFPSFGFVLVTFSGTSNTSLLIVSMPDWRDSVFPLLQAITVFLMFGVLIPAGSNLPLLADWYAVVGAHAMIGAIWIWSHPAKTPPPSSDTRLPPLVRPTL